MCVYIYTYYDSIWNGKMVCNKPRGHLCLSLQRSAAWKYWGIVSGIFLWMESSQSQLKVESEDCCKILGSSKNLCWESSELVLKVWHLENKSLGSNLSALCIDWRWFRHIWSEYCPSIYLRQNFCLSSETTWRNANTLCASCCKAGQFMLK